MLGAYKDGNGGKVTEGVHKEFEDKITKFASEYLKTKEICRRFEVKDFINTIEKDRIETTDEYYEHALEYINQNKTNMQELLQKMRCTQEELGQKIQVMEKKMQLKKDLQEALFRYKPETPAKMRPVHAIATDDPYGEFDNKHLEFFSKDIAVFFDRDRLENVSSVVGNDSIAIVRKDRHGSVEIIACPEPLASPTHNIFPLEVEVENYEFDGPPVSPWYPPEHFDNPRNMPIRYFEVHMHRCMMNEPLGPDHMKRVVIGDPLKLGEDITRKVKGLCEDRNIQCDVGKSKEDSQRLRQNIPWIKELFIDSSY